MDQFSRTLLPAAAEAGLSTVTVSRHSPAFRRCIDHHDSVVLLSACLRPDRPLAGEYVLLLTRRRLVVTQETRLFGRIRVHLDEAIAQLDHVVWTARPEIAAIEIAATTETGRHRFWVNLPSARLVWRLDATFARLFTPTPEGALGMAV